MNYPNKTDIGLKGPYHNYSTHQEALMLAFSRTTGKVLELGCGYYSTPLLYHLCRATGREFVSVDSHPDWVGQFTEYGVSQTVDWKVGHLDAQLVLVDGPVKPVNRGAMIERYKDAQVLVVHDSEPENRHKYDYDDFSGFRYVRHFIRQWPNTTLLSNQIDVNSWI